MTFQSSNNLSGFPQPFTRVFPAPIISQRVPQTSDYKYAIGQVWIDELGQDAYVLVNVASNIAQWNLMASEPGTLDTLKGDNGIAISPSAGNIDIVGTSNEITTTGSGSQIAFSIPATFIAPGSAEVTTTLTSAGATTLATTGASVNTFGNATGATSVTITSGTGGIALASTSTGDITLDSDDTLLIDADGVLEINSSAGVIGIGNDADAQNINIGTGAAARIITIGNVSSTTGLALNSGTGGIAMVSTTTGDVTIASADTCLIDCAGVLELNSSGGVIGIGNDAVAQNINIGTGAAARTITLGNVTLASALVLNSGTGGIALASTSTGDITLNSSDTVLIDSVGVLELNSSGGNIGIGNDAVAHNINVGTGAAARIITVGNVTTSTGIVLNSGTGGVAINTTTTGDVVVTSADTVLIDSAGVLELNSSAGVIGIGNDAVAQAINIGTGAAQRTITIGNVSGTSAVNINTGSGGTTLTATNAAVTVASGTGEIDISADAAATTVKVGTGNGAKTVTLGSVTTTSATTVQGGSNGVTITGTNGAVTINSGTGAMSISSDAAATTVNIATGGAVKALTLGSTSSTSATTLQSGSGALTLATTGVIGINSATGTISISTDASATTLNIGTGGAAKIVTIGSTSTTSAVTLQSGSGDVTVSGGNLKINTAAKQLQVHGGAVTDFIGEATLSSGTIVVANTNIATADRIFVSRRSINGSTALGMLTYSISNATSFTITAVQTATPAATETNDISIVEYFIVRQLA